MEEKGKVDGRTEEDEREGWTLFRSQKFSPAPPVTHVKVQINLMSVYGTNLFFVIFIHVYVCMYDFFQFV